MPIINLIGDIHQNINELNRVIALGGPYIDGYKRALRSLLRENVINEPDIDPSLKNLPEKVASRIRMLDSYLEIPEYENCASSIEAVKKAYKDGSLEIRGGFWTIWVGGKQKTGYIKSPIEIGPKPYDLFFKWSREEGGSRVFMEDPTEPHYQIGMWEDPSTYRIPNNEPRRGTETWRRDLPIRPYDGNHVMRASASCVRSGRVD
ncbi:hypothetical protein F5884DRAFT_807017 [Xylogone sp. PMI_703]|nr:hypothetical protein F5884DRAFT_807017 [Xylogone sp. PMI_703]